MRRIGLVAVAAVCNDSRLFTWWIVAGCGFAAMVWWLWREFILWEVEMVKMTVEQAMKIQADQLDWYCRNLSPEKAAALREQIAARTDVRDLEPGVEYPVTFINRCVPRGGDIEALLGIDGGGP